MHAETNLQSENDGEVTTWRTTKQVEGLLRLSEVDEETLSSRSKLTPSCSVEKRNVEMYEFGTRHTQIWAARFTSHHTAQDLSYQRSPRKQNVVILLACCFIGP